MSNVIDIAYKLAGSPRLQIDKSRGTISALPSTPRQDYGDRLMRIKQSLDRINKLMLELKRGISDGIN